LLSDQGGPLHAAVAIPVGVDNEHRAVGFWHEDLGAVPRHGGEEQGDQDGNSDEGRDDLGHGGMVAKRPPAGQIALLTSST
jgi:hypothetical protein